MHIDPNATTHRTGDTARVMDALRRSVQALRSANADATRRSGVGAAQLFVLRTMAESPGLSLAQLAAQTHTSQSSVSEVVARLVSQGYVQKTPAPDDARRRVLELTERGAATVIDTDVPVQQRLITGLLELSAEERRRLAELFEAWLLAAGLKGTRATMFFAADRDKL